MNTRLQFFLNLFSASGRRMKFALLGLLFLVSQACSTVFAQSWVGTPGGTVPNDAVATSYFPYKATTNANISYGTSSSEIGDIYLPDYTGKTVPANSTSRPAVVVVHGGGGTSGTRIETRSIQTCQLLAAHGYVAFNVDYALGAVWPKNLTDWRLAVRWLRAHAATYGIDTNHIGLGGGSFGGFAAAMMSGVTNGQHTLIADSNAKYNNINIDTDGQGNPGTYSGNVQCVFDMYGPTDQTTSGNAQGQYSSPTTATLFNSSGINYVWAGSAPAMISQGTADGTVNISQSYEFTNALAKAKVPYYFTPIPGGQHTFCIYDTTKGGTWPSSSPSGTIDLRKETMDWFDKWLLVANDPPIITQQPQNTTGCVGSSATFNVVVTGATPLYYEWFIPGITPSFSTTPAYTIASLTAGNAGSCYVVISNNVGVTTSASVSLAVNTATPPIIGTQPANQTVTAGNPAGFSVAMSAGTALNYQWYGPNGVINGATNATYSIANSGNSDAGTYQVVVFNTCNAVISSNAVLTVNGPPSISAQPGAQTTCDSNSATFFATAIGTQPLSYQWYGPAGTIGGATTNILTLNNLLPANSGNYYLVVTNSYGQGVSSNAYLTVSTSSPVGFSSQPNNAEVVAGGTATFIVTPTGGGNYTYFWHKNDADPIPGAVVTNSTLVLNNVSPSQAGTYACLVNNDCSSASSISANLVVDYAPVILNQPQNQAGLSGLPASFAVSVAGTAPLSFQWYKGSNLISGAVSAIYTIASPTTNDVGKYSVVITNAFGSATSATASLAIVAGISYMQEPFNYPTEPLSQATPWSSHVPTNCTGLAVTSGGLTYPSLSSMVPSGNWMTVTPIKGQTNCYRPFDNRVTNGIIYLSMIMQAVSQPGTAGYYNIGLLPSSTTTPGGRTTDPFVMLVKSNANSTYVIGVGSAGAAGDIYAYGKPLTLNNTNLVVFKYNLSTMRADLFVNPVLTNEPATPDATTNGATAFSDINYFYYRSVAGSGTFNYDSIRIASTWAGAVPYVAPPPPPPATNQFLMGYDAGQGFFGGEILEVTNVSGAGLSVWSSPNPSVSVTNWTLEGLMAEQVYNDNSGKSLYSINVNPLYSPVYYIIAQTNTGLFTPTEPVLWLTTPDYQNFSVTGASVPINTNGVFIFTTPPVITQSPVSQSVLAGQNSSFSVTATGSNLGYQWFFNSNGISGATAPLLGLTKVSTTNAGVYVVIATNSAGSATSGVATLNVALPPVVKLGVSAPGSIQFNADSITGLTYVVQSASNLVNPVWLPVLTNNTGIGGAMTYQTNTANGSGLFYRLMFP